MNSESKKIKICFCTDCFEDFEISNTVKFTEHTLQEHRVIEVPALKTDNSLVILLYCNTCKRSISYTEKKLHNTHVVVGDERTPKERQKDFVDRQKETEENKAFKDKTSNEEKENLIKDITERITASDKASSNKIKLKQCTDYIKTKLKKIVISEENTKAVYGLVEKHDNLDLIELKSDNAVYWVNYTWKEKDEFVYPSSFQETVLHDIISEAHMNGTAIEHIYLRIAQLQDNTFYYHLGNKSGELVKITKESIEIVKLSEDLPLFRKGLTTSPQYLPRFEDSQKDFEEFVKLFHLIDENEEKLFSVNLISLFLQKCAIPIPFFDGMAGSFKSTNSSLIKMLIDPSGESLLSNRQAMPEKVEDLILSLYDQYLIAFDNISKVDQEQSDVLCRGITGGSNSKRKLFTDTNQINVTLLRKIVGNGVSPNLSYTDLNDRMINYSRKSMDDVKYITDSELELIAHRLIPSVLGFCFTILQKAILIHDSIAIAPKTRLADFEQWGESIARSLGIEEGVFLKLFHAKRLNSAEEEREKNPLVDIIIEMVEKNEKKELTIGLKQLFNLVKINAEERGIDLKDKYSKIPRQESRLSTELTKNHAPTFKKLGYSIASYRETSRKNPNVSHGTTVIHISKQTKLFEED